MAGDHDSEHEPSGNEPPPKRRWGMYRNPERQAEQERLEAVGLAREEAEEAAKAAKLAGPLPLKADGTSFSERLTPKGIWDLVERRDAKEKAKEKARQERAATEQKISDFLRDLPEFKVGNEARIKRVSQELIKTLWPEVTKTR